MTFTTSFRTGNGAALRTVHANAEAFPQHVAQSDEIEALPRIDTPIFTLFPERTARARIEAREAARRKACLIGMCAPTSIFLALAGWYLAL